MAVVAENIFPSLSVKVAELLGITGALVLAGFNIGLSYAAIPSLHHPYSHHAATTATVTPSQVRVVAQQWRSMYNRGVKFAPALALFTLINFLYVANAFRRYHHELYAGHHRGYFKSGGSAEADTDAAYLTHIWRGWILAGILDIAIIPFTFLAIVKVNSQLSELTKEKGKVEKEASDGGDVAKLTELLERWAKLNFGRAFLSLLSGLVGLVALIASAKI